MVYRHLHNFSSFRVTSGQSCAISCLRSPERPPLSYSSCATIKTTGKSAPGRLSLHWKVPGFYAILITTDQHTKPGGHSYGGNEERAGAGGAAPGDLGHRRRAAGRGGWLRLQKLCAGHHVLPVHIGKPVQLHQPGRGRGRQRRV